MRLNAANTTWALTEPEIESNALKCFADSRWLRNPFFAYFLL